MDGDPALTCAFCRTAVTDEPSRCAACTTVMHAACVAELAACPTIGCAGRLPGMRPARAPAPSSPGKLQPARSRARVVVLAALLLTTLGWGAWRTVLHGRDPFRARPALSGRLLLLGLEGTDRDLVRTIAAGIEREYGLTVEVIADGPPPVDAVLPRPRGRVLDADALLAQGEAVLGERASAAGVRGFLVVTAADIADAQTNFVLGLADRGRGVMSTARFAHGARRHLERRCVAQALSSTGLILGIPRCATPTCARAYVGDIVAHDAKEDALCGDCVAALLARR